jgi:hypothetical protein
LPPSLGLKISAKLHFLFLLHFVSAGHLYQSSYRVRRPFEFPGLPSCSPLFSLSVLRRTLVSCLCRFIVVVLSSSFLLVLSIAILSSVVSPFMLFSVSAFLSGLLALSIPVLYSIVSSLFSSCLLRSFYGSTRLTYPYPYRSRLSFLFSPIDRLRLNPSSFYQSSFRRTTRPLPPSIHPATSFVASTSFLDCLGFPSPFRLGVLAVFPHCRFDSSPFCLGVTSPWVVEGPSKTSVFILRLPSRPITSYQSSFYRLCNSSSPVIASCQSAAVRLHPCLRLCQCLHGIAIVFPLFHHRIPAVIRSPDLWLPFGFSVSSLVFRLRYCSVFSVTLFPAQPASSSFLASIRSTVVYSTRLSFHLD